jgi:hypothetical protein
LLFLAPCASRPRCHLLQQRLLPPPAASRVATASQANPDLSHVGGSARPAQSTAGEAAAPPRRTGLLGSIKRHQEEKNAHLSLGYRLLHQLGGDGPRCLQFSCNDGERRAAKMLSRAAKDINGNWRGNEVLKMANHFCASEAFETSKPSYGHSYSYSSRNLKVQAYPFREAIYQKGKNLRLLATIAAVPAEVTLENARNNEERALVEAALKAGEQLVFRIPNKTIHDWGRHVEDFWKLTPQKTIYCWSDKLTALDRTATRINSPRDISPQMVRDLLQRPAQFHALHAISKPEHAEDNQTLQTKVFGPLQEALEDSNGPRVNRATKDCQVNNLLKLQQVARGELLGLTSGSGAESGLKHVMHDTGWRVGRRSTAPPTPESKAKFEAFRAVAKDLLQAAKIPEQDVSRLVGGNDIPDVFITKMLLNPRQAVEDIKVDIEARKVNEAQRAAENTKPEVSRTAGAHYSQVRNDAETPPPPPPAQVTPERQDRFDSLVSETRPSGARLSVNPELKIQVQRVVDEQKAERAAAQVETGREQLRSQLSSQLPILPNDLVNDMVAEQTPENILAFIKKPNEAVAELIKSLGAGSDAAEPGISAVRTIPTEGNPPAWTNTVGARFTTSSSIPTLDISNSQGNNSTGIPRPAPTASGSFGSAPYTREQTYSAGSASGSSSSPAPRYSPAVHRASASTQQVARRDAPARVPGFVVTPLPLINPVGVGLRFDGIIPMPVIKIGPFRLL